MLEKTMKQVLKKKVDKWLDSIEDESVKEAIKKDLIITGGCFTSMIQNEEANDFDCYFRTRETVLKVSEYYVDVWNLKHKGNKICFVLDGDNPSKNEGMEMVKCPEGRIKLYIGSDGVAGDPKEVNTHENLGINKTITELDEVELAKIEEAEKAKGMEDFFPVFISSNALTLSSKVQIIVRFYGEPSEIHDNYDFVHTKGYWTYNDNFISISKEVYEHTINKTLKYTGSLYPVCSLFRLRKFINRGWKINAGQILKMCIQVSQLDLRDITVLEDQLVGVDSSYFMALIQQFRDIQEKKKDFELTSNYVISIIDKIF